MTVKRSVEEYSFDTVAVCAKILIKEMTEMEEKETVTQRERLEQQLRFIVEADKYFPANLSGRRTAKGE